MSDDSHISINNSQYDAAKFLKFGCFVEQEEALWQGSTPREIFEFCAKIKTNMSALQIKKRVDYLLYLLGLQDCQHTPCGGMFIDGLSGGERKRTSIGCELVTLPKLIILDEPTSGLDSECALSIMKYLKKLTKLNNTTIICSIHQPSSKIMALCDQV